MRRSRSHIRWTATERASLRVAWHDAAWSWREIADALKRTVAACKGQAPLCGLPLRRRPR